MPRTGQPRFAPHRLRRWTVAVLTLLVASVGLIAVEPARAATGDGSPTDPNIVFTGRWNTANSAAYVPNWAGAYFTTGFTGTTVKLRQRNTIDLYYSIDGATFSYLTNVSGTVSLTPTPLASGTHTLRVSYRVVAGSYTGDAVFQGLVLDSGAHTVAVSVPSRLVEFIGDSITVGQTSSKVALTAYGWLIGEQLGLRHTQIAQGGACLRDLTAAQSTRGIACVGLEKRFVHTGAQDNSGDWDFSRYSADVVVINLGTNDTSHGVSTADFQTGYTNLLHTIRSKYPNAAILALRTFVGRYAAQTQAAVTTLNNAGDRNVFYVDTTGWVNSSLLNDSVHPNDAGHQAIAAKLAPIVQAHLGTVTTTTAPTTRTTTTTTTTAPTSTTTTTTSRTAASTTSSGTARGCTAAFTVASAWTGGFVGNVTVSAATALTGWKVSMALPSGAAITGMWGGTNSGTAGTVTVTNASYNGTLSAGGSTTFGFQATGTGTGTAVSCTAS